MAMKTIDTHGTFKDAIAESSPAAQRIARALRKLVADVYPNATEVPWRAQHNIGYGIGPKKATEHFAYIGAHSNHVNLGLNHGAALADPDGQLEGTGKAFRHVKLGALDDVSRPGLRKLIVAAVRERERAEG